jgi:GDPmannose 4,6-dehydratase
MTDSDSLKRAVRDSQPTEIYNLAAQSFVPMSWASPTYTMNVNAGGVVYLLEAVRDCGDPIKVYQASTSEMYGNAGIGDKWVNVTDEEAQGAFIAEDGGLSLNENSPMRPRSPYGVSKLAAHRMIQVYRESFGMFACSGILFNHESPRRGDMFVTRKITKAAAKIVMGKQQKMDLGNLAARRDWGFAGDYVVAMWTMLQQEQPLDYVIGTGITHSVEDVVAFALEKAQAIYGKKLSKPWDSYVHVAEKYFRPAEIFTLKADYSKAETMMGWKPRTSFGDLIEMMVMMDIEEEAD